MEMAGKRRSDTGAAVEAPADSSEGANRPFFTTMVIYLVEKPVGPLPLANRSRVPCAEVRRRRRPQVVRTASRFFRARSLDSGDTSGAREVER